MISNGGTLTIKGDAETATKNWKIRHIPLIPDAKTLLERLRKDRLGLHQEDPILLVGDVRGAFERAADELGVKANSLQPAPSLRNDLH